MATTTSQQHHHRRQHFFQKKTTFLTSEVKFDQKILGLKKVTSSNFSSQEKINTDEKTKLLDHYLYFLRCTPLQPEILSPRNHEM